MLADSAEGNVRPAAGRAEEVEAEEAEETVSESGSEAAGDECVAGSEVVELL